MSIYERESIASRSPKVVERSQKERHMVRAVWHMNDRTSVQELHVL